jgi:mono/diheme cytochrome c family protein
MRARAFYSATLIIVFAVAADLRAEDAAFFGREVLPILSENCFSCHGPDESNRKAELRLDLRDGALQAITEGEPDSSELIARVVSDDSETLMPPPSSHKPRLKPAQVETLRTWIKSGATWGKHWAYEKPQRSPEPVTIDKQLEADCPSYFPLRSPIDQFVWARLRKEELTPASEAERHTLLRRLSFDLTGLPPTIEELKAFDGSDASYEAAVDRLLASPHFGERMAMWWLDAARYADTDGFQSDANRENWSWRDWVIEAFNSNMRFDQFTLEQFAGDLIPNATAEQKLATAFHRNHMTNGEGGRDPEESRVDYVLDRVNTTGSVWLGLTLGCTQCHSHKFDPITQADYYGLTGFFNSIDEDGKAGKGAKPYLTYESKYVDRAIQEAQQLVDSRQGPEVAARTAADTPFEEWLAAREQDVQQGYNAWTPLLGALESSEGTLLTQSDDAIVQADGPNPNQDDYRLIAPVKLSRVTGLRLEVMPHDSHTRAAFSRGRSGEFILTDVKVQVRKKGSSQIRDILVKSVMADFIPTGNGGYGDVKGLLDDDPRNGWTTKGASGIGPHYAVLALAEPLVLASDEELIIELRQRSTLGDANLGRFRISATDQRGPAVTEIGPAPLEQLSQSSAIDEKLRARLFEQFLTDHEAYQICKRALDRAVAQLNEAKAAKKTEVMVLAEKPEPRDTHILVRGVWDKHGDKVLRGGLTSIAPLATENPTRADLARWLTSSENPLTARVLVNHLWQLCFGTGLVKTTEDFGLQGEQPSHPELLDWLAVECVESGWDVKHVLKLIVMSSTYRQSSKVDESLLARDPENRLLARGARFRLPAWMLRDNALRASELFHPTIGGPPVRPYQPTGVWEENFMGRFTYEPSEGSAQYRRTLYAFWRRSIAPTFLFDSAQRRSCEVRTSRTNTPLQALTLLNDENYLEASRALAAMVLGKPQPIQEMSLRVLSRELREAELTVLTRERDRALDHYRNHPEDAVTFLARGQFEPDPSLPAPELAAHTIVASLLFNLDEAMTHE